MLIIPRGSVKPPLGAQFDSGHPFARKLLFCFPFLGVSRHTFSGTSANDLILAIWGITARRTVTVHHASVNPYGSNRDGICMAAGEDSTIVIPTDPIPAARATVCLIRRKRDTTNRNGTSFSPGGATVGERCSAFAPFSDGVVYWDFGGAASPNRLSVSGLSFSTTIPEKWIFIAGPRGMAIWQNGVKVASTATANPGRTVNLATNFNVNGFAAGSASGDVQDFNYFAVYDDEWSDAMCRWWSAEPYAALYQPLSRSVFDFGAAGGGGGNAFPALTVAI